MDRNIQCLRLHALLADVALRKESVDRNYKFLVFDCIQGRSLSARRAWIEIRNNKFVQLSTGRRSPQGERG